MKVDKQCKICKTMSKKLKHDSTATFKPIIYQFYIALEKCFEMVEKESVYIEKYGDVTVSESIQIEVKDYSDDLTDSHENLWKTLKNWIDIDFNVSLYKSLILLTTQKLSKESSLINWNTKSPTDKKEILKNIYSNYQKQVKKSEATKKLFNLVLDDSNESKLNVILEKFIILDSSNGDDKLYEILKQRHCKVLSINKDNFINSLLGYIISPPITSTGWEITYDNFTVKVSSLVEEYSITTKIFPKRYSDSIIPEADKSKFTDYKFVEKIKDIDYPDVIGEAITDFVNTRKTIMDELNQHQIGKRYYEIYEGELHRSYSNKHRIASRNSNLETTKNDSKDFYDAIMDYPVQDFRNFNDTPLFFRNGLLHEMANSNSDKRNIVWKLDIKDE